MTTRFLLCAALLTASPLAAQTSALKHHNSDAPVEVDADRLQASDNDAQALLTGSVRIRQAELDLNADQVKLFYRRVGGKDPEIQRMDATGHVVLTSPTERATGRTGVYDVVQRVITMVGDVVLTRGENVLRGQRLTIDLDSGRSTLDGAGGGGSKTVPAAKGGRVSGRFVVPPRQQK